MLLFLQACLVAQIFMLFLVHAYSTRIWKRQASDSTSLSAAAVEHGFQSPEGHAKLIMDGPWILLWPCLLLWPCFEGIIGYGFIHNGIGEEWLFLMSLMRLLYCVLHQYLFCLPHGNAVSTSMHGYL